MALMLRPEKAHTEDGGSRQECSLQAMDTSPALVEAIAGQSSDIFAEACRSAYGVPKGTWLQYTPQAEPFGLRINNA